MNKKILLLTSRYPLPAVGGEKLRIFKISEYLYNEGYTIDIISLANTSTKNIQWPYGDSKVIKHKLIAKLTGTFKALLSGIPLQVGYYNSKEIAKLYNKAIKSSDYCATLCHLIRMFPYCENNKIPVILEMTDAISLNYSRLIKPKNILEWIYKFEYRTVPTYEEHCINNCQQSVLVSSIDKKFIEQRLNNKSSSNIQVIPNGVSLNKSPVIKTPDSLRIGFIGNMRSKQNEDAAIFFLENIFPLVRKKHPTAEFLVIGANPSNKLISAVKSQQRASLTYEVAEPSQVIKQCFVTVAPMRYGAGMQNKVLESMACGVPVVSSNYAYQGIKELTEGKHLLVADIQSPSSFVNAICRLKENEELWETISQNAYNMCKNFFEWRKQLSTYKIIIDNLNSKD